MGGQVNSFLQELRVKPLHDFHCLETFCSGVESMDIFIRNDFRMSVENHYCAAYVVTYQDEVVAVFALSSHGESWGQVLGYSPDTCPHDYIPHDYMQKKKQCSL